VLRRARNQDTCWWCGVRPADSREHKLKRTDLIREFGPGPYPELVSVREGRERRVQGPNSALAKFKATLCVSCNNERSQPFDRAYDEFATYLRARERHVLASRSIDLRAIYGREWEPGRDALLRYCVKHIGCRLAENEFELPASARHYLDGRAEPRAEVAMEFEIRADIAAATRSNQLPASLWLGDVLITEFDRRGGPQTIESHLGYRWLRIAWGVGSELQGYPWPFRSPVMALASDSIVKPGTMGRGQVDIRAPVVRQ
jgi:hypothetical protein